MPVKKSTVEVDEEVAPDPEDEEVVAEDDPLDDEPDLPEPLPEPDTEVAGPPAPITPDTPGDEAQRRIGLERLVNGQVEDLLARVRAFAPDHLLAGRTVHLVAVNPDGSTYDPEG